MSKRNKTTETLASTLEAPTFVEAPPETPVRTQALTEEELFGLPKQVVPPELPGFPKGVSNEREQGGYVPGRYCGECGTSLAYTAQICRHCMPHYQATPGSNVQNMATPAIARALKMPWDA
jgi:hypothetical protein